MYSALISITFGTQMYWRGYRRLERRQYSESIDHFDILALFLKVLFISGYLENKNSLTPILKKLLNVALHKAQSWDLNFLVKNTSFSSVLQMKIIHFLCEWLKNIVKNVACDDCYR